MYHTWGFPRTIHCNAAGNFVAGDRPEHRNVGPALILGIPPRRGFFDIDPQDVRSGPRGLDWLAVALTYLPRVVISARVQDRELVGASLWSAHIHLSHTFRRQCHRRCSFWWHGTPRFEFV